MVSLKLVQQSNAALRSTTSDQVSLFVGATSGLALATLTEYTRHSTRPKVYIVGRNPSKLSSIINDLENINPQGIYIPIKSEFSLFKNVDTACEELKQKEKSLDLLLMCPGYLKAGRVPDNEDGIEDTISLRYYVRARFIQNLLPLLSSSSSARIVSIHGAGKEGHLNEEDLELKHTYTMQNAAMHTSTMNTLALEEVAATHPTISCVHVFPGLVITPAFATFSEDWPLPLRVLFRRVVLPPMKLFTTSLPESGQRHLFHATSARFPPAGVKDPPGAGVARPPGVEVARGADWKDGSGCYLLSYDGEAIGDRVLLDDYRQRNMGKKIWQHTQEVFDRALVKAIKFEDEDDARKPADHATVPGHSEDHREDLSDQDYTDWDDEQATLVNSASYTDHDGGTSACSDDDGDAGLVDTGSLLWRRITSLLPLTVFRRAQPPVR